MMAMAAAGDDCKKHTICPSVYAPVCGQKGTTKKTFSNICAFNSETCGEKGWFMYLFLTYLIPVLEFRIKKIIPRQY